MPLKHLSRRIEKAYLYWIKRFISLPRETPSPRQGRARNPELPFRLGGSRKGRSLHPESGPQGPGLPLTRTFSTQSSGISVPSRARRPKRLPVVLTVNEVRRVLGGLNGTPRTVAALLYGSGMRPLESLRLRNKDVDFGYRQIVVRDAKGAKDQLTMLPKSLTASTETTRRNCPDDLSSGQVNWLCAWRSIRGRREQGQSALP